MLTLLNNPWLYTQHSSKLVTLFHMGPFGLKKYCKIETQIVGQKCLQKYEDEENQYLNAWGLRRKNIMIDIFAWPKYFDVEK